MGSRWRSSTQHSSPNTFDPTHCENFSTRPQKLHTSVDLIARRLRGGKKRVKFRVTKTNYTKEKTRNKINGKNSQRKKSPTRFPRELTNARRERYLQKPGKKLYFVNRWHIFAKFHQALLRNYARSNFEDFTLLDSFTSIDKMNKALGKISRWWNLEVKFL